MLQTTKSALVFLFILACQHSAVAQQYNHPSYTFSFSPPAYWSKAKEDDRQVAYNAPGAQATIQVIISTSQLHASGFRDKAWVKKTGARLAGGFKMQVASTQKTTLAGKPALRFNLRGKNTLLGGAASGFFVVGATHKGKRLSVVGLQKEPANPTLTKALEDALASVKKR